MPAHAVVVPLSSAGPDRPWRAIAIAVPFGAAAIVCIPLGSSAASDSLLMVGSLAAIVAGVLAIVGIGGLGSLASASRAARRTSGDLGATHYGSSDPHALVRQATLSAIASQGPFDTSRLTQRRWLRIFASLPRPVPAIVAERFRNSIRAPIGGVEGRVNAAPGFGGAVATACLCVLLAGMCVGSYGRAGGGTPSWLGLAWGIASIVALAGLVLGLLLAFMSGAAWVRRLTAPLAGWLIIDEQGVSDRAGRRWTPIDSLLVIEPVSDSGRIALARLVGPAGVRRFRLGSAASEQTGRLLLAWSHAIEAVRRRADEHAQRGANEAGAASAAAPGSAPAWRSAVEDDATLHGAERWLAGGVGAQKLEEEIPAAVAPADWRAETDERDIESVTVPLLRPLGSARLVRTLAVLGVVQLAVLGAMLALNVPLAFVAVMTCAPAVLLLAPTILGVVQFVRAERDRLAAVRAAKRILAEPEISPASRAIASALVGTPIFGRLDSEGRRWAKAIASLSPLPTALVAPGLLIHVRDLGRTARFLEPHSIEPGSVGGAPLAAGVVNLGVAALMLIVGQLWLAAIFAFLALVTLVRVPFIWYRLPIGRGGRRSLLVGPGWVRDPKGRIWTVRDSTLLVAPAADKGGVLARLVGPAGARDLIFSYAGDPEFTALWRLWTHRDPRPDLAQSQ